MSKKRVLVTGGLGFVGKAVLGILKASDCEICLLGRTAPLNNTSNFIQCDLFDAIQIKNVINQIKPDYLIHLAWDTTHESYLKSDSNLDFVIASLNLLRFFAEAGGERALFCGTCNEYEYDDMPLNENSKIRPNTLYAASKTGLHTIAEQYAKEHNISFVWTRLFYLFGENEKPTRVFPYVLNNLQSGNAIVCKNLSAVRDYMYVGDVAEALIKTLFSDVEGAVNICSGEQLTMGQFFLTIADICGHVDLVTLLDGAVAPKTMVGDNTRLKKEVGFVLNTSFKQRVREFINKENKIKQ